MKKIAIVTVYGEQNYGNKFQNYALIKIYTELGFEVNTMQVFQSALIHSLKFKIKYGIKESISIIPIPNEYRFIVLRKNNFIRFSKNYLSLSERYNTHNFDYNVLNIYDYISVGSDQVWNDINFDQKDVEYYSMLNTQNSNVFSFAASLGKNTFQDKYKNLFIKALNKYKFISCREGSGADYLDKLLNKKCYTFLDPTLFLEKKDWDYICRRPKWLKNKRYNLLYFLGGVPDNLEVNNNLLNIDVLNPKSIAYTASPSEFIYILKNAEMVYTDSYHACVFSLIYKKSFYVFDRKNQTADMSSRIKTLFATFKIGRGYGQKITPSDYKNFDDIRAELTNKELNLLKKVICTD